MSEELGNGVKILISRVKSNPEEFTGHNSPWKTLVQSILNYKHNPQHTDTYSMRGLTSAEIDALHEAFFPLARQEFDSWVMKTVLEDKVAQDERMMHQAMNLTQHSFALERGKRAQNLYNPYATTSMPITLAGNTTIQGQLDADPSPALLQKIKKGLGL